MANKKVTIEYIWIDSKLKLRSKTRVIKDDNIDKIPEWNYDGSSTFQAEGHDSEIIIKPVRTCPCPFRKNNNLLVLCDAYNYKDEPV